ncbi:NAD(P)H-binding protein [Methylobacterium currus]|uniref:NAD(P)H-binding protein n=1 Tax=Methylobacterium currus TaxID=2051553 RepID=UPI003B82FF2E
MRALFRACAEAEIRRVVQVSTVGAAPDARTAFLRTKDAADAALAQADLDWTILRPGLVLAPTAYGGTALLRAARLRAAPPPRGRWRRADPDCACGGCGRGRAPRHRGASAGASSRRSRRG